MNMNSTQVDMTREREEAVAVYFAKVCLWMFVGLMTTAVVGFLVVETKLIEKFYSESGMGIMLGLIILELVLVIALSRAVTKMPPLVGKILFMFYSIINGLTLSTIFLAYNLGSVGMVFGLTAVLFGGLALYGLTTKKDLTNIGALALFGLIAIIIVSLVNVFIGSEMMETIICIAGVVAFLALTAFDTQKIKQYYYTFENDEKRLDQMAIYGALSLYLDFINIFIMLLRLLGKRN